MADRTYVVSELLCYLCYKYSKCHALALKTSIVDFYSPADISAAKDLILEEARSLNLENLPRRRRDSVDNKARLDIDDIFCTLAMLDEKKLMDKMPIYVARNVENIPMLKMKEGEFRVLKHGLNSLANDVKKVNMEIMNKFGALGESLCAQFESHVRSVIQTMNVELDRKLDSLLSSLSAIPFRSSAQVDHSASGSQGNKQNITSEVVNRFIDKNRFIDDNASMDTSSVDTSDVENRHEVDNNSDFIEFQGRRKRRKKLVSKEISPSKRDAIGKAAGASQLNFSQAVVRNKAMMVVPTQPIQKPKNINFDGKRQTVEGGLSRGLTASRSLLKKTFHVSNVARAYSADDITSYVRENLKVSLISCFEIVKKNKDGDPIITWTAKNGKTYDIPKAFRVCIDGDDSTKFLNMETWPEDVVIRRWTFNKKNDPPTTEAANENSTEGSEKLTNDSSGLALESAVESIVTDSSSWFTQTSDILGETSIQSHGGP